MRRAGGHGARTEVDHESDHRSSRRRRHNRRRRAHLLLDDRGSMGSRGSKKSRGSLTKASSGRRLGNPRGRPRCSYAEFCEAALRLAMLKWEDAGHALDDSVSKVRDAMWVPAVARTPRLHANAACVRGPPFRWGVDTFPATTADSAKPAAMSANSRASSRPSPAFQTRRNARGGTANNERGAARRLQRAFTTAGSWKDAREHDHGHADHRRTLSKNAISTWRRHRRTRRMCANDGMNSIARQPKRCPPRQRRRSVGH